MGGDVSPYSSSPKASSSTTFELSSKGWFFLLRMFSKAPTRSTAERPVKLRKKQQLMLHTPKKHRSSVWFFRIKHLPTALQFLFPTGRFLGQVLCHRYDSLFPKNRHFDKKVRSCVTSLIAYSRRTSTLTSSAFPRYSWKTASTVRTCTKCSVMEFE